MDENTGRKKGMKDMFEKFGEFNTADEINASASGLKAEGDTEGLRELAKENGIDEEIVEMYIDGDIEMLCDNEMAAAGKLDVESAELDISEIMLDWVEYIKNCIVKDENMAKAVRKKGKSLKACIAELLVWSFKNAKPVDKDILKAAGVSNGCKLGIPGMGRAKQIIRDYYLK